MQTTPRKFKISQLANETFSRDLFPEIEHDEFALYKLVKIFKNGILHNKII